jgi:hypothetical protein
MSTLLHKGLQTEPKLPLQLLNPRTAMGDRVATTSFSQSVSETVTVYNYIAMNSSEHDDCLSSGSQTMR